MEYKSVDAKRIPSTRRASNTLRCRCSCCGSSFELHNSTEYPEERAVSSTPRTTSTKKLLEKSGITTPIVVVFLTRRLRATSSRRRPRLAERSEKHTSELHSRF